MKEYDVIVVGAGNGGLMAACTLQKAGRNVLLLEKHNLPGGCGSSFRRGRFEFEIALHELGGTNQPGTPGGVRARLGGFGAEIDFCEIPEAFRLIATGRDGKPIDVTMPTGREAFLNEMERCVPGCRDGVIKFMDLADECEEAIGAIAMGKCGSQEELCAMFPGYAAVLGVPVDDVMESMGLSKRAQDILNAYWSYLGVDTSRITFEHYAACMSGYIKYGASIPRYNSHGMNTAFLEAFRSMGGKVWFNTEVRSLLIENGAVCGVKTDSGEIKARRVIANLSPHTVYTKLLPAELAPERERRLANARRLSFRPFVTWVGLDKSAEELGIRDYAVFVMGSADSREAYKRMQNIETNDYYIAICYNTVNPGFSPEGTCVLSFTAMYSGDDWENVTQEEYAELKTRIAEKTIADYEAKTGVHIRDSIEEIETGSPWSFARYIGVPNGAVYGYETDEWDGIVPRMLSLGMANPIPGLRICGATDVMGDGYGPSYDSGELQAMLTLGELAAEAKA